MTNENQQSAFSAAEIRIALSEIDPESTHGAVPVFDQYDALETYRAYDGGGLESVPQALAAYVDAQQRLWL